MKSRTMIYITTITLFVSLLVSVRVAAQQQEGKEFPRYTLIDLGTLGGTSSSGEGINNNRWVSGFSLLKGDNITHAFVWRDGMMKGIGTPERNSIMSYPFNERGEAAIIAEVSTPDPLGEDFCGFFTHLGCPPAVWQKGILTQLPTLGGNNGHTSQVNNRGEVAGMAENSTPDATCVAARTNQECVEGVICPFQLLQTKPALWKRDKIQELQTLPGDPDGNALVINDKGEAAGTSGQCVASANEALHAVLWRDGTVIDLGNLGGTTNNHPQYINNRGEVVGYSNLAGDSTTHAFLWTEDIGMKDLGTLPGDTFSFGEAINDVGEVGGYSCDINFNCRAFIWQNDVMKDLNTLIPTGAPLFLIDVFSMNSPGEITGEAVEISTGEVHAYLARPENNAAGQRATVMEQGLATQDEKIVRPEKIRSALRQQLGSRYQIPSFGAPRK